MELQDAYRTYLEKTVEVLLADAENKKQAVPREFRVVADNETAQLWGADYFKYLVVGRGPGKQPPPAAMLEHVKKHPDMLSRARQTFKNITEKSLAYIIGRSIGEKGTLIYQGKKPGIDFIGAMDANMDELLKNIARNEALKIVTNIRNGLNR